MRAAFYKAIWRNEESGEAEFLVQPAEACEYARDGLVRCRGNTGLYAYGMPLIIDGKYDTGQRVFVVKPQGVSIDQGETGEKILYYACPDATEKEMKSLRLLLGEEHVYDYCRRRDAKHRIGEIIGNRRAGTFVSRVKKLFETKALSDILIRFAVPADVMFRVAESGMTVSSFIRDPFQCCRFAGMDVFLADVIGQELSHMDPYDSRRINGFVRDAMQLYESSGNTCMEWESFVRMVNGRLRSSTCPDTEFSSSILVNAVIGMDDADLTGDDETLFIYSKRSLDAECAVARHITRLNASGTDIEHNIDPKSIEKSLGVHYTDEQEKAMQAVANGGVKILTGPPGSGKTMTVRGLIAAFRAAHPKARVRLCATTGRAAKVMASATEERASTVHKLLDIRPFGDMISCKGEGNPIEADLIILDEASMLDVYTASLFFGAIKNGTTVILVGDEDQLASVDCGNVLHDIIRCGEVPVYRLTRVMRQGGAILDNARMIMTGGGDLIEDSSFIIRHAATEEDALDLFSNDFRGGECMVASTVNKGDAGVNHLNAILQDKNGTPVLFYGTKSYYLGDRVIMTKTDYDRGYINGDIGEITACMEDGSLEVQFDHGALLLSRNDFSNMSLAYAVTVHRMQGSEFDDVYIILPERPSIMLTRRLLYTAVTRARKHVFLYLIGDALRLALEDKGEGRRMSLLAERLTREKARKIKIV